MEKRLYKLTQSTTTTAETNWVTVSIKGPDRKGASYKISTKSPFNFQETVLEEGRLDSTGIATSKLQLQMKTFASLVVEGIPYEIYLEPGNNLEAMIPSKDITGEVIEFAGTGAGANNYMAQTSKILENFYGKRGNLFAAEPSVFTAWLDTLNEEMNAQHGFYNEGGGLSKEARMLLSNKIRLNIINLRQQYLLIHGDSSLGGNRTGEAHSPISKEILLDENLLDVNMVDYGMVLDLYLRTEIYPPLTNSKLSEDPEEAKSSLPLATDEEIRKGSHSRGVREFLLAKNIDYWLAQNGITASVDTIYSRFRQEFGGSSYLTSLNKSHSEWLAISAGQPAPNISGVTADGKPFSLSSLRGKTVYIDVWATWCLPCRQEFPFYKDLQREFSDKREVEFLFVSVDRDRSKWESYIASTGTPKGTHVLELKSDLHPSIFEAYKIWGIPRYIIVGKDGKVLNPNAPRPSSGKVIASINGLLKL